MGLLGVNCEQRRRRSPSPSPPAAPRILIAPSGFKESLSPGAAADYIENGIRRVLPGAIISKAPMVDGGEGSTRALVEASAGKIHDIAVIGPVGDEVESHYGYLGSVGNTNPERTAVLEMAAAAGLSLVPRDRRNPLYTTTYGVGQLISAALDGGAQRILLGCGDSGTCDGGVGMAQALGARFYNSNDELIPNATGAVDLADLARVDLSGLDKRVKRVKIDVACNPHNILCGERGVARIFGPQKGASPEDVERLSTAMDNIGRLVSEHVGKDICHALGSGASGGLGAGLMLIGAELHSRFEILSRFLQLDERIAAADVVITAEGSVDDQTPKGKVPGEIAQRASAIAEREGTRRVPVIALAGTLGKDAKDCYKSGVDGMASIVQKPCKLEEAIERAEAWLEDAAEGVARMVNIGFAMGFDNGYMEADANGVVSPVVPTPASNPFGTGMKSKILPTVKEQEVTPAFSLVRRRTALA